MLRLLSLLQSGRRWAAQDLSRAMDVPARTLRRDLDHLRALGYPVESVRGPGGHYRLVAGAALPPLMLDDDEATAIVLGLRLASAGGTGVAYTGEAAERAGAKLRRVLPASLRRRTDEVLAAVEFAHADHPRVDSGVLSALTRAISTRNCVAFEHHGKSGVSGRVVEPMRLVQIRGRWYLYAWDRERNDWRNFRVDRIVEPRATQETFQPRPLPTEDLARHIEARFHGTGTTRIVLTLHTDVRDAANRLHRIDGVLEAIDDHSCRYIASVDSFTWITVVLTVTDIEFSVDGPADFRAFLEHTGRRLLRAT